MDVDFPAAYREQCGLDSLLQTAGRCNREGRRSAAESKVYCFRLEGCAVPQMLHQHVHALQYAARCHENDYAQLNLIFRSFTLHGVPRHWTKKAFWMRSATAFPAVSSRLRRWPRNSS